MSEENAVPPSEGDRAVPASNTQVTAVVPVTLSDPRQAPGTVVQTPFDVAKAAEESRVSESVAFVTVPGYEIEGELGRGGMGVVYKARHAKLNRVVALKMARGARVGERELIRFLAEAEAVAAVKHPNVVQVYDYGETDGQPYMALEFCAGGSLSDRVKDGKRMDAVAAASLVAKVAAGVAVAHGQGIVHRDLKPGNILLDAADEPKVADFGIAKRAGRDLTETQAMMGTPDYMAPEQAGGKAKFVGPPADVWALGIILYECLTGTKPFTAESANEVLAKVLMSESPPLTKLAGGISPDLNLIYRKCLEKNPADRYPSAHELSDDLLRFLRGESISIRAPGIIERVYKWTRRNPPRAAAYGLIVVAVGLSALAGGAVWLWRDAESRGVQAEQDRQMAVTLRDREANQRRQELLQAASAAEAETLDRLRTGRHRAAKVALDEFLPRLRGDPQLADRLSSLEARRRQAERLDQFYMYAGAVWHGAWDDDRIGDELAATGQAALVSLGVMTPDGRFVSSEWWSQLPDNDLGEDQRARLRGEVYQQLIILAVTHLREAGRPLGKRFETGGLLALLRADPIPEAAARVRKSLEFTEQARAWERSQGVPPTRTVVLMRRGSAMMLEWLGDAATAKQVRATEEVAGPVRVTHSAITSAEFFFDGLLHLNMSLYGSNATMQMISVLLKQEFEVVHTKQRAEESFRIAASLDPNRFWPHFMLGLALLHRNDHGGAELAFTNCIRLEPKEPRGYIYRAKALGNRAASLSAATDAYSVQFRKDLIARGLADRDQALTLDPLLAEAYLISGDLYTTLGRTPDAIAQYGRYLELEDRTILGRPLRRHWLTELGTVLAPVLKAEPNNPDAYAVSALLQLRRNDFAGALTAAEKCLQLQPDNARALAVRGSVRFQNKEWDAAEKDFDRALQLAPTNYFAAVGRALSFERTEQYEKALNAYDTMLAATGPAVVKWQQAEAHLGRSRVLEKLKRFEEAATALATAQQKDAKAVVYLRANPPLPR